MLALLVVHGARVLAPVLGNGDIKMLLLHVKPLVLPQTSIPRRSS